MKSYRLRPRFEQSLDGEVEAVQDLISNFFAKEFSAFEIRRFPGFTCIRIPEEDRHFWSPRLNLSFEGEEDSATRIQGYYGPNANVWGMLLFGYMMLGFVALIAAMFVVTQYVIGGELWAGWILAGSSGGVVLLYIAARTGRIIGERQVLRLHRAYEKAVGEPVAIR